MATGADLLTLSCSLFFSLFFPFTAEENENWKNENEEKQNYVRRMVHQETGQK